MTETCRICANSAGQKTFCFQEKMFGMGGEFVYFQCGQCGCLQIATVPQDMSRYYPPGYYSFELRPVPQQGIKAWLAGKRDFACATSRRFGRWAAGRSDLVCLARVPLRRTMRI